MPVIVALDQLNEKAFVRILSEPKNSLTKQYEHLFLMDGVEVEFTESALKAIAKKAAERNTGARGLRGIMENIMQKLMYELPSQTDVYKVIINEDCVTKGSEYAELLKDETKRRESLIGDTVSL